FRGAVGDFWRFAHIVVKLCCGRHDVVAREQSQEDKVDPLRVNLRLIGEEIVLGVADGSDERAADLTPRVYLAIPFGEADDRMVLEAEAPRQGKGVANADEPKRVPSGLGHKGSLVPPGVCPDGELAAIGDGGLKGNVWPEAARKGAARGNRFLRDQPFSMIGKPDDYLRHEEAKRNTQAKGKELGPPGVLPPTDWRDRGSRC